MQPLRAQFYRVMAQTEFYPAPISILRKIVLFALGSGAYLRAVLGIAQGIAGVVEAADAPHENEDQTRQCYVEQVLIDRLGPA